MNAVPIRSLIRRGVEFRAHEAVAIAQQLIHSTVDIELIGPLGPPTAESVAILPDGRVTSLSSAVTPAVSEVGRLLESMLPKGRGQAVPGGLRYAVARALLDVDAPPFDSLDALSASLARFEAGDRQQVVRSLLARADGVGPRLVPKPAPPLVVGDAMERVAFSPVDQAGPTELGPVVEIAPPTVRRKRHRGFMWGAAAAAVVLSFAVGWQAGTRITRERAAPVASTTVEVVPGATMPTPESSTVSGATRGVSPIEMYSPAFSADGRSMFFHTGGSRAPRSALMRRNGGDGDGRPTPIVDDGARNYHAQPSPDGRRVAFDSDRDGGRAVYIADADGSNVRRVSGPGYAAVPTWSPDGDRLAFVRAEAANPKVWNLWLLTLSTGELRRLTRFTYGQTWAASWLPDGHRVLFSHEDRLVMLSLADRRLQSYPTPVRGRIVRTPAVSPDGTRVIFQVWRDGVWLLDLESGAMRRVLDDPTAEEFAWSPDGRRVAYHRRADGRWAIHMFTPPDGRL